MTTSLRRALVTGAGGFLGRSLVRELERNGTHVTALARTAVAGPAATGEPSWDPRRLAAVLEAVEPDAVFHLAGTATGPAARLEAVNLGLARALMAALGLLRIRPLLVVCGSAAEYGDGVVDGIATAETAPCAPQGAYGASKLAQTRAALEFGAASGTRVLVARIFNPIGPGMPPHLALADFAGQIAAMPRTGGVLRTGDLETARDFMDVDLAARALRLLAGHPGAAGVVNVCGGTPTRLSYLLDLLIAASGKPVRTERDPARLRGGEKRAVFGDPTLLWQLAGRLDDTDHPAVAARIWDHAARAGDVQADDGRAGDGPAGGARWTA